MKAWSYALATVIFWSTVATAFKLALAHLSPLDLLFYSSWIATFILAFIVITSGRIQGIRSWSSKDLLTSLGLGILNPCGYYLILFEAYNRLPAQEALPLNFAWPVVLVLLSMVILGQKISLLSIFALLMSFAGVLIIATRGEPFSLDFDEPVGVSLALGSTLVWGLYWIINSSDQKDSISRLFVNFLCGAIVLSMIKVVLGPWNWPVIPGLFAAGYIALFEMAFAFICWLQALKLAVNTAQVSSLIFLTPFLSLVVISLVLGEQIHSGTLFGLVMIVAGIVMQKCIEAGVLRFRNL